MQGPHSISELRSLVNNSKVGAFILSRDGKTAHYVGRSDEDIVARIEKLVKIGGEYKFFWYEITGSSLDAYNLESQWFHKYHPADSKDHPSVVPGASWKCPVAGCPRS